MSESLAFEKPADSLDEKIKIALLGGKTIEDYRKTTDLSMQYSHDTDFYKAFGL